MTYLIDQEAQTRIAKLIDSAVEQVLGEIASHGNEEGMTTALGHSLMKQHIRESDLRGDFKYRQHNKYTEESHSGADGGFLVRVVTPDGTVEKAALFQAKLIGGFGDVRTLTMSSSEAKRLQGQSQDMLRHTQDAVAIFYTHKNIYVVDAKDYSSSATSKAPLSQEHRLISRPCKIQCAARWGVWRKRSPHSVKDVQRPRDCRFVNLSATSKAASA